jgi:pyridoxine 4-dehydrogenase
VSERPADAAGTVRIGDRTVNRMGFGAMRLTNPAAGAPLEPADAHRLLRRAVDLGVTLIDTALAYGGGRSETLICEALHPYPDDLLIATKGGLEPDGRVDGRPENLRRACEGSLERLGVETIDLYQLHAVDRDVPLADSLGALVELRAEGKIRHVGVSNVRPEQLEAALAIAPITAVQNRYDWGERAWEPVLRICEWRRIAFLAYGPLGQGALVGRDGPLAGVAAARGATPAQVALAWVLQRSPVATVIPGTASPEHLEEDVGAAELALEEADLRQLEELS